MQPGVRRIGMRSKQQATGQDYSIQLVLCLEEEHGEQTAGSDPGHRSRPKCMRVIGPDVFASHYDKCSTGQPNNSGRIGDDSVRRRRQVVREPKPCTQKQDLPGFKSHKDAFFHSAWIRLRSLEVLLAR